MKRTVAISVGLVLLALGSPASAAGSWTNAKVRQQLTPIVKSTNVAIAAELSEIRSKKAAKVFAGLAALNRTAQSYDSRAEPLRRHATGRLGKSIGQSLVDAVAVALYSSEVSTDIDNNDVNAVSSDAGKLNAAAIKLHRDDSAALNP